MLEEKGDWKTTQMWRRLWTFKSLHSYTMSTKKLS